MELSFYQMINLVVVVNQNKIDIKTVFIFIFLRLKKLKKRWLIYRPPGMKGLIPGSGPGMMVTLS